MWCWPHSCTDGFLASVWCQMERAEHAQTCAVLMAERERTQCAETEVEVIRKQLEREKATFEKAYANWLPCL